MRLGSGTSKARRMKARGPQRRSGGGPQGSELGVRPLEGPAAGLLPPLAAHGPAGESAATAVAHLPTGKRAPDARVSPRCLGGRRPPLHHHRRSSRTSPTAAVRPFVFALTRAAPRPGAGRAASLRARDSRGRAGPAGPVSDLPDEVEVYESEPWLRDRAPDGDGRAARLRFENVTGTSLSQLVLTGDRETGFVLAGIAIPILKQGLMLPVLLSYICSEVAFASHSTAWRSASRPGLALARDLASPISGLSSVDPLSPTVRRSIGRCAWHGLGLLSHSSTPAHRPRDRCAVAAPLRPSAGKIVMVDEHPRRGSRWRSRCKSPSVAAFVVQDLVLDVASLGLATVAPASVCPACHPRHASGRGRRA